jgi:oxygen-independent coproporphyrinogen-3 oxidase
LEHYEVSSFARPGERCRHNETYWLGLPWLAFGPGAAGYDGRVRTVNHRSLHTYLRRLRSGESPVAERDELDDEQQVRERFVFGMRRLEGVDLKSLALPSVPEPERLFEPHLERALQSGWFQREGDRIRLTHAGLVISDALWPNFLSG